MCIYSNRGKRKTEEVENIGKGEKTKEGRVFGEGCGFDEEDGLVCVGWWR